MADLTPILVSQMTPLTDLQSSDIFYVVRPSFGTDGSRNIASNTALSPLTQGIQDKVLRLEPGSSPLVSAGTNCAVYFDGAHLLLSIAGAPYHQIIDEVATQTLLNKTLNGATLGQPHVSDYSFATHDHSSVAQGGPLGALPQTLTDISPGTVLVNCNNGYYEHFRLLLTGATGNTRILGTPATPRDGQICLFEVTQSSAGGNLLTFSGAYSFGVEIPSITLSTGSNLTDIITTLYNAPSGKFRVVGFEHGY